MKKIICLVLIITLILSLPVSAASNKVSKAQKILNNQMTEVQRILDEETGDIDYLKNGTYSWDIILDGKTNGTVTLENEKIISLDEIQTRGNYEVSDGNWTTTYTFDLVVNGELMLKSYYTVSNNETVITPTGSDTNLIPPFGYTHDYDSSYQTSTNNTMFTTKGTYTMIMFKTGFPLTYVIKSNFWLLPSPNPDGTNLNVSTFINP